MIGGLSLAKKLTKEPEKIHDRMARDLLRNAQVAPAVVDDPLERGSKLKVVRSLRDDPLAGMKARGQIDDAEYNAGRKYQFFQDRAEIGGIRAIDPTKEAVDGKRIPEPITDRQIQAAKELAGVETELGMEGSALVRDILGSRLTIAQAAQKRGYNSERARLYVGGRFKECLDTMAVRWGFAMRVKR